MPSAPPAPGKPAPQAKITALELRQRKSQAAGAPRKITAITAYDVTFARLADRAGLDIVLVGDSLGMVVQGHDTTLPVTLDEMVYHARITSRGVTRAHLVADLPFMTYQASIEQGLSAAGRLIKEGRAESVKVEGGGAELCALVARLVEIGIPVMGHLGMTPQSFHGFGGFKVQGRGQTYDQAHPIVTAALALAQAGAYSLVLEGIPAALAALVTQHVPVPTIGIGAGAHCDGQILVMHDVLGLNPDWKPRFARAYAQLGRATQEAFAAYAADVQAGRFPSDDESYK
jgi:3-methyl-2-oxobutanoate hydroxymethyltransferase